MCILQYNSKGTSQIRFPNLVYINSIVADFSILNIIKPVDQICNGCFSCSCRTYKGNFLSWLCIQFHIMKHNLIIIVPEIHTIKYYISLKLNIIYRTICLMCMLPCPASGMFLTFYKFSIFFFHIDQSHIPVIYFHFLIQKGKDTLCSCKCHYNSIHLLADLVDRHTKAFIECQKACQCTQCKSSHTIQCKGTSDNRTDYITDISDLRIQRSEVVCIGIRTVCAYKKCLIQLFKFCLTFFLMAEDLDNLLPIHHFFNITIDFSKIFLLFQEIFPTLSGGFLGTKYHNCNHDHRHNRKWNI